MLEAISPDAQHPRYPSTRRVPGGSVIDRIAAERAESELLAALGSTEWRTCAARTPACLVAGLAGFTTSPNLREPGALFERLAATDPVRYRVVDRRNTDKHEAAEQIPTWIGAAAANFTC